MDAHIFFLLFRRHIVAPLRVAPSDGISIRSHHRMDAKKQSRSTADKTFIPRKQVVIAWRSKSVAIGAASISLNYASNAYSRYYVKVVKLGDGNDYALQRWRYCDHHQ